MSRRSRKKPVKRAVKTTPDEPAPARGFALSLALAMRKSQSDTNPGNPVAQNRNERLDALASAVGHCA